MLLVPVLLIVSLANLDMLLLSSLSLMLLANVFNVLNHALLVCIINIHALLVLEASNLVDGIVSLPSTMDSLSHSILT